MNKLTKIGLSALCGSLASVAGANAGTLEVLGSAQITHTVKTGIVGNPIGMNTGLTFKGSGELDGGQTFSVSLTDTDKAAWSSANITLTTNSSGKFVLSSAEGGQGIGGYDDIMPTAWEEVWDTAVATNANFQKGVGSSTNLSWTSPAVSSTTLQVAWAPANDGVQNDNKAVSGNASNYFGEGLDVVLDIKPEFDNGSINLFIGGSRTDTPSKRSATHRVGKHEEAVVGLVLSLGPVEAGAQISAERMRARGLNNPDYYANSSWAVAFNINDDLSISYGEHKSVQANTHKASNPGGANSKAQNFQTNEYTPKAWMRGDSVQIAYTIGGVGLKYAETSYDNTAYGFDTKTPGDARVLAVSLAF